MKHPTTLLGAVLLLAMCAAPHAYAASVKVDRGNIIMIDDAGSARPLTAGGLDSDPVLSPDHLSIVFVRRTPHRMVNTASGAESADEAWVMHIDGTAQRRLVEGAGAEDPKRTLAAFSSPIFSPDGQTVYFMSVAWVTSSSIHSVELSSGKERFVTDGNSLEIVPAGKYRGDLVVNKHKYWLASGSYDWYWLVSPTGKEIAPIGPGDESIEEFRSLFVK
ncbi:hypothetical protein BWP39_05680 [Paraburkholderia acidicola]|uniref:WD40 repeat protein n=1 Tax=Paraburkholderia acidicola TaxID=1912599 RepID=A0A2A4F5Y3_9BURK|nr:PD40 domain-containing protein [Paraburkholderia acidicola]PCE27994.1 hypothetical protein BWP39_05680 [Paraburkholderia acidicola]